MKKSIILYRIMRVALKKTAGWHDEEKIVRR